MKNVLKMLNAALRLSNKNAYYTTHRIVINLLEHLLNRDDKIIIIITSETVTQVTDDEKEGYKLL